MSTTTTNYRWYVAPGCLPVRVQVETVYGGSGCRVHLIDGQPVSGKVCETEREALEYTLKQKREAKEMAERAYDEVYARIARMETREIAEGF